MLTLQFLGKLTAILPLLFRVVVGASFAFSHGLGKIAPGGTFDGGQAFAAKGIAWAPLMYVAAWTEFLGGLAVLGGIFTRWAAIGLLGVMIYAIFGVHWKAGFAAPEGYEMAAVYSTLCLAIMALGPGSLSLDRLFFSKAALNP
jgi:putative oxidoreductase